MLALRGPARRGPPSGALPGGKGLPDCKYPHSQEHYWHMVAAVLVSGPCSAQFELGALVLARRAKPGACGLVLGGPAHFALPAPDQAHLHVASQVCGQSRLGVRPRGPECWGGACELRQAAHPGVWRPGHGRGRVALRRPAPRPAQAVQAGSEQGAGVEVRSVVGMPPWRRAACPWPPGSRGGRVLAGRALHRCG